MLKIYLCAPMFDEADIIYNLSLTKQLRMEGFDVYCPNENMEINDKSKFGITPEKIYITDIVELESSNILLCRICDDPGVMWEAGYMDCLSKAMPDKYKGCIGLTTDIRWQTKPNVTLSKADNQAYYFNGFVIGGLKNSLGVYYSIEDLINVLKKL